MTLDKLRYSLTEHIKKVFMTYVNFKLLIHPSVNEQDELLDRVMDDIELMPEIKPTQDGVEIKFYKYDYNENVFNKSELLAFIFGSINSDWNIIKGIDLFTGKPHFWLKSGNVVFDPSLSIITSEEIYFSSKRFRQIKEIKNEDIIEYLRKKNNLYQFYKKGIFRIFHRKNNRNFSVSFINEIIEAFTRNVESQYSLDDEKLKHLKEYIWHDNFIELRQVLTKKRKSFLRSSKIAVHPSIDESILDEIEKVSRRVCELLKKEYDVKMDYHNGTLGNCHALSIMFSLFDEKFKLIQGGITYPKHGFDGPTDYFYQHSWLEKDGIIYDPAFRIVTPKELYYTFVQKQDEYTKKQTENILRRLGFNLTHFRDFMNGIQIGNDETISYRYLVKKIGSSNMREAGEKLIKLVGTYKH